MPQPKIHPSEIKIEDFQYDLPDERIARFPLAIRDQSKLLVYKQGSITESIYHNIADFIPEDSLLLFNQAKVIHARLYFQKATGGRLEIFCLEPDERYADITTAMFQEGEVYWKCLIKGASKWKDESALMMTANYVNQSGQTVEFTAKAEKVKREGQAFILRISWTSNTDKQFSFAEFLEHAGKIPIPPYLKRQAEESDETRYQTIFAKQEGSVAAPTAGLHFTPSVLEQIKAKGIVMDHLTLHVGAGTFMPVKSDKMEGHEMHSEWIEIPIHLLQSVAKQLKADKKVITIGTTSARTLESAYWIGVKMLRNEWKDEHGIAVDQWYPYLRTDEFTPLQAVEALISYLTTQKMDKLITRTQLIIASGYEFKLLDALITNFHQPASTLLLMISALVGDKWKEIYNYAMQHDFRFLSYGDGSLLWK